MSAQQGFAIWLTGLPAAGKSSISRELVKELAQREVSIVVLESDEMRRILTPKPTYTDKERDAFYRSLALIGELITRSGINVIFDATANKRIYREFARGRIERFLEVYVQCPLELCIKRDPKGIYRSASSDGTGTVPGLQTPYESPLNPEVVLQGRNPVQESVHMILDKLKQLLYI
jgi:adenylylsulfate kinase